MAFLRTRRIAFLCSLYPWLGPLLSKATKMLTALYYERQKIGELPFPPLTRRFGRLQPFGTTVGLLAHSRADSACRTCPRAAGHRSWSSPPATCQYQVRLRNGSTCQIDGSRFHCIFHCLKCDMFITILDLTLHSIIHHEKHPHSLIRDEEGN